MWRRTLYRARTLKEPRQTKCKHDTGKCDRSIVKEIRAKYSRYLPLNLKLIRRNCGYLLAQIRSRYFQSVVPGNKGRRQENITRIYGRGFDRYSLVFTDEDVIQRVEHCIGDGHVRTLIEAKIRKAYSNRHTLSRSRTRSDNERIGLYILGHPRKRIAKHKEIHENEKKGAQRPCPGGFVHPPMISCYA